MVKIAHCEIECDFISPYEISKYYFSFLVLISKQIIYKSNEIVARCHLLFDFVSIVRRFESAMVFGQKKSNKYNRG
jgi:hypothetical protein